MQFKSIFKYLEKWPPIEKAEFQKERQCDVLRRTNCSAQVPRGLHSPPQKRPLSRVDGLQSSGGPVCQEVEAAYFTKTRLT